MNMTSFRHCIGVWVSDVVPSRLWMLIMQFHCFSLRYNSPKLLHVVLKLLVSTHKDKLSKVSS